MYRVKAIESLLFQVDSAGIAGDGEGVRKLTRRNAGSEIEDRLEEVGFDLLAINAEIYTQAREIIAMFDGLMHAAQSRRNLLIREISMCKATEPRVPACVKAVMHEP